MNTPLLQEMVSSSLVVTINRPKKRNALSGDVANALTEAIEKAHSDNSTRSVIFPGAGTGAFSSGTDLKERAAATADRKWQLSRRLFEINRSRRSGMTEACGLAPLLPIAFSFSPSELGVES